MKNVYVFCSFAVIMLGMVVSSYFLYSEISGLKQELADMTDIQEQQMSQQNLRMEMVESSLERVHVALSADEQSEMELEAGQDAAAFAQEQQHVEAAQETASEQQASTGYDLKMIDSVLYVYAAGKEEPMITLPVSDGYLTETQRSLLERGLHIEDMQEVYHLLESYSS